MKKYFIICCLFLSTAFMVFGQRMIKVEGYINGKDKEQILKPAVINNVLIKMIIADKVFQSTFLKSDGSFEFYKLCPTKKFKLKFFYLNYSIKPVVRFDKPLKNKIVADCRFDVNHFSDSVVKLKDFKLPDCVTLECFGNSSVEYELQLIVLSLKYRFRYRNQGCSSFDEKEINQKAIKKLNKDLGDNWEKVFWQEVKVKLK